MTQPVFLSAFPVFGSRKCINLRVLNWYSYRMQLRLKKKGGLSFTMLQEYLNPIIQYKFYQENWKLPKYDRELLGKQALLFNGLDSESQKTPLYSSFFSDQTDRENDNASESFNTFMRRGVPERAKELNKHLTAPMTLFGLFDALEEGEITFNYTWDLQGNELGYFMTFFKSLGLVQVSWARCYGTPSSII